VALPGSSRLLRRRYASAVHDTVPDSDGCCRSIPARPSKHGASNPATQARLITQKRWLRAVTLPGAEPGAVQSVIAVAARPRRPVSGKHVPHVYLSVHRAGSLASRPPEKMNTRNRPTASRRQATWPGTRPPWTTSVAVRGKPDGVSHRPLGTATCPRARDTTTPAPQDPMSLS
jgi:hypothetical protein